MANDFLKFVQFTKLEDTADGPLIWGIATHEQPDLDNEVCSYADAVPVYEAWSAAALARTQKAGQEDSLGNIRLQHGLDIGGKATKLQFDPIAKAVLLGSQPLNDQIHDDLKAGFYTGYSQGGSYAYRKCSDCDRNLTLQQANNWCPTCKKNVTVLYGLKRLSEVSYVDSPCSGVGFEHVKADGSRAAIKFAKRSEGMELTQEQIEKIADQVRKGDAKTKRKGGKDCPADCFAYVGDPEKPETWKLVIKSPDEDVDWEKRHIRDALSRFSQTKGIPEDEKPKVKAKIVAAAKKFGIEVSDEGETKARQEFMAAVAKLGESAGLTKDLWTVGRLADILQSLACLYEQSVWEREVEGDDSEVPDDLKSSLDSMIEIFIAMATEEAKELAAHKADITHKGGATMTPEELEKAAKKTLAVHFAKSAVLHEKLAANHEKAKESHEQMCDACKAARSASKTDKADEGKDTPSASVASGDYYKAAMAHHAAKASHHEKMAKAHSAHADHLHKFAEEHDTEEHEKAVKAAKDADAVAEVAVVKTVPTIDADVVAAKAAFRDSDEYKKTVNELAKAQVESDLAKQRADIDAAAAKLRETTVAPDGVRLAAAGGVPATIVPRSGDPEPFKFAKAESTVSSAGI